MKKIEDIWGKSRTQPIYNKVEGFRPVTYAPKNIHIGLGPKPLEISPVNDPYEIQKRKLILDWARYKEPWPLFKFSKKIPVKDKSKPTIVRVRIRGRDY